MCNGVSDGDRTRNPRSHSPNASGQDGQRGRKHEAIGRAGLALKEVAQ